MDDETVPTYTETDTESLAALLASIPDAQTILSLPLTSYPQQPPITNNIFDDDNPVNPYITPYITPDPTPTPQQDKPQTPSPPPSLTPHQIYTLQTQLITTLHHAITTHNTDLVTHLITTGLLSPDVPSATGSTPLITAITTGSGPLLTPLLSLGAQPNRYGIHSSSSSSSCNPRTPLMVAASLGRLPLVKLLLDNGADDALIAPDGQLALRLAADHGHRDVVDFLPARRGGAFRRWKVHHEVAVRRVRRAGRNIWRFIRFFVWDVPRFLGWSCPKHVVVLPLWKGCRFCWENKARFRGWCGRQVRALPGRVRRGAVKVWEGSKKMPGVVWRGVKAVGRGLRELPGLVERFVVWVWGVMRRIPGAMKMVGVWIWAWLKRAGVAVGDVFLRMVSAVHTAVVAVLGVFRDVKLKDVWGGICAVLRALFVELPRAVGSGLLVAGKVARDVLEGLFGCLGLLVFYFFKGLWLVAQYVPKQLWAIICGIGSSMAKGYHEILVWLNPKH